MSQFPQQWQSRFGTNGGREATNRRPAAPPAGVSPADNATLTFGPDALVQAVVFHLLDGGLAREVAGDSVRRTASRLRRDGICPSIRRGTWRLMTHAGRLEWLLSKSVTVPLTHPGGMVTLGTRDER